MKAAERHALFARVALRAVASGSGFFTALAAGVIGWLDPEGDPDLPSAFVGAPFLSVLVGLATAERSPDAVARCSRGA